MKLEFESWGGTETPETNLHVVRKPEVMVCGHPRNCLVQADEGTAHCGWCEEVAGLRAALAKRIHEHRADMVSVLHARNKAAEQVYEWYGECCKEVGKLRKELERVRLKLRIGESMQRPNFVIHDGHNTRTISPVCVLEVTDDSSS